MPADKKNTQPIFIIGNPRSGTTLLRLILSAHSRIVVPPECGFAVWYYNKYKNWRSLDIETRLNDFLSDLSKAKKIELWKLDFKTLKKHIIKQRPGTYAELINSIYYFYGLRIKKLKRWGDKNNFYLKKIPTIKKLFPDAYFIHIIRDGRDVACSYKWLAQQNIKSIYAPQLPNKIEDIAKEWNENLKSIKRSFSSFNYQNVLEIKFENLIVESETTIKQICLFLKEKFEINMLKYYNLTEKQGVEPGEFERWKAKNKKPFIKTESKRYKKELSSQEIQTFNKIAGNMLKTYHYLVSV